MSTSQLVAASTSGRQLTIRPMDATDLHRGFLAALCSLKAVEMSHERAMQIFAWRLRERIRTYVAIQNDCVAGTATLLLEPKFIHDGRMVGHIEDVAVHSEHQHQGIGAALVKHLLDVCRQAGCYKVILDCADDVIPFYEKLGFHQWERAMRVDM